MMTLVKQLSVTLAFCLAGCCWQPSYSERHQNDLFVTLEWYGPVTESVLEVAFASKANTADLKQWIAYNRRTRSGATISEEECTRLRSLIEEKLFAICKTAIKPTDDNPQYVLTWHSHQGIWYYPIGFGDSAKPLLMELKGALYASSATLVGRIITETR